MKAKWFFISFIFLTIKLFGQVELNIDKQKILIGEQIKVNYTLQTLASDTVRLPTFADTLIKPIEILAVSKIDTAFNPNDVTKKIYSQTLTITSFDSGYHAARPLQFLVNNQLVESKPFLVEVHTLPLEDTQSIKDIKQPLTDDLTFVDYIKLYWHYAALALFVILVSLVIAKYIVSRKKLVVQQIIEKPQIPPHQIALEKLQQLKKQKLWQTGNIKGYFTSLSNIIREYIELRYKILALEQSTSEIISDLNQITDISDELKKQLIELLQLSDLVKFAKQKTVPEENEKLFNYAVNFVENTKYEQQQNQSSTIKTSANA